MREPERHHHTFAETRRTFTLSLSLGVGLLLLSLLLKLYRAEIAVALGGSVIAAKVLLTVAAAGSLGYSYHWRRNFGDSRVPFGDKLRIGFLVANGLLCAVALFVV